MIDNVRKALKEDLWKIINKEELKEKDEESFILLLLYLFLEKKEFNMNEVVEFAKQFKTKYYQLLEESKDIAIMGDPIKALNNIDSRFYDLITPIIERLISAIEN